MTMINAGSKVRASRERAGKEFAGGSQEVCRAKGPSSQGLLQQEEVRWGGWCGAGAAQPGRCGAFVPAPAAGTKMKKMESTKRTY